MTVRHKVQGGGDEVARVFLRWGSEQDKGGSDRIILDGIDLRIGSDMVQGRGKGLVEANVGIADTLWILVSPHDERFSRGLPQ